MNNYFLRMEHYGGYLLDRDTLDEWELNTSTTIFALLYKSTNDYELSKEIAESFIDSGAISYEITNYCGLLKSNVSIEGTNKNELLINCKDIVNMFSKLNYFASPSEITLYPTLDCQLNCDFCFIETKNNDESILSLNDWKEILNAFDLMGGASISLLGGEPTLYKDIIPLINHIESLGIRATITTNGLSLREDLIDTLIGSRYITPTFSIQSLSDINIQRMGVSSDVIIKSLNDLLIKGKMCRIHSVLLNQSFEDICNMIDFCCDNNIDRYSLGHYLYKNSPYKHENSFEYTRIMQERLNDYVVKKNYKNFTAQIEGCLLYSAYEKEAPTDIIETVFDIYNYGCECGNNKIEIMCNGYSFPCIAFETTKFKDNIKSYSGLQELWNSSPILTRFRGLRSKEIQECCSCNFMRFCNGGCHYVNYMTYGDIGIGKDKRCNVTL
ncbi:MAG: radical SAM protein [Oscillospiraceae bacterium]|nr:radical SAM protein [Oscillospiraceae bacterium]